MSHEDTPDSGSSTRPNAWLWHGVLEMRFLLDNNVDSSNVIRGPAGDIVPFPLGQLGRLGLLLDLFNHLGLFAHGVSPFENVSFVNSGGAADAPKSTVFTL